MQYKVPIHVRHSFSGKPGTWVREGATMMERPSVVGVTTDRKVAKITLLDVKDQPGIAAHVFRDLADAEINVRLIIQAAPAHERNRITFIIESDDIDAVKALIPGWKKSKTAGRVEIDTDVAKIAIVGSRIASTPGLGARMFTALADRSINIDCISTSEMKVSCIIAEKHLDDAARAIHAEFFGQVVTSEREEGGPRRAAKKTAPRAAAKRRGARA
jgi:aspartate kinase